MKNKPNIFSRICMITGIATIVLMGLFCLAFITVEFFVYSLYVAIVTGAVSAVTGIIGIIKERRPYTIIALVICVIGDYFAYSFFFALLYFFL